MQFALRCALLISTLVALNSTVVWAQQNNPPGIRFDVPQGPRLGLTSKSFNDVAEVPLKHTCLAKPTATSPGLLFENAPKETVSYVIMVHDMEPRPRKSFDDPMHWLVWDIPAEVHELAENASQSGLPQGARQLGRGYFGFCVPPGTTHHYLFELFAMDQKLNLPADASRGDVSKAMDGHILDHAVLIGLWHRPLQ
jgi:Raf kinase inhibitor-like YbhB/YbcL family protein